MVSPTYNMDLLVRKHTDQSFLTPHAMAAAGYITLIKEATGTIRGFLGVLDVVYGLAKRYLSDKPNPYDLKIIQNGFSNICRATVESFALITAIVMQANKQFKFLSSNFESAWMTLGCGSFLIGGMSLAFYDVGYSYLGHMINSKNIQSSDYILRDGKLFKSSEFSHRQRTPFEIRDQVLKQGYRQVSVYSSPLSVYW